MKDRSDDPSHHERTLLPQSYISLPFRTKEIGCNLDGPLKWEREMCDVLEFSRLEVAQKCYKNIVAEYCHYKLQT